MHKVLKIHFFPSHSLNPFMTQNELGSNENLEKDEGISELESNFPDPAELIFKFPNEKTCGACTESHTRNPFCAEISKKIKIVRSTHCARCFKECLIIL